jgi:hypothetical protein
MDAAKQQYDPDEILTPGRTFGDDTSIQRGRLTPDIDSSDHHVPDPPLLVKRAPWVLHRDTSGQDRRGC